MILVLHISCMAVPADVYKDTASSAAELKCFFRSKPFQDNVPKPLYIA